MNKPPDCMVMNFPFLSSIRASESLFLPLHKKKGLICNHFIEILQQEIQIFPPNSFLIRKIEGAHFTLLRFLFLQVKNILLSASASKRKLFLWPRSKFYQNQYLTEHFSNCCSKIFHSDFSKCKKNSRIKVKIKNSSYLSKSWKTKNVVKAPKRLVTLSEPFFSKFARLILVQGKAPAKTSMQTFICLGCSSLEKVLKSFFFFQTHFFSFCEVFCECKAILEKFANHEQM